MKKLILICIFLIASSSIGFSQVKGLFFRLYTKRNKVFAQELIASNNNSIVRSNFVKNKPVKFLTHGYASSYLFEFPQQMKNTYLGLSTDYNVIAVDWATLSNPPYTTAATNVRIVGFEIAKLIAALLSLGYSQLSDFHHIGHSLGAQVGAFISTNLSTGKKLSRITGLDPGRPGFENSVPASDRLDPNDANFVDIITTSCGIYCASSIADPARGTVDFYPNGGLLQPGCENQDSNTGGLCSHCRSYQFYTESITTSVGFKSYKCNSYKDFLAGCTRTQSAYMGEFVATTVTGTYYLSTNVNTPYAQG